MPGGLPETGLRYGSRASAVSARGVGYVRWILALLALLGLMLVVSLVVLVERRRPAVLAPAPRRRREPRAEKVELMCSYCQSRTVVFNPRLEIYRCVDCGFSGALPPAFLAKVGRMHDSPTSADEVGRRSNR
jgi:ribosomal protein S27E